MQLPVLMYHGVTASDRYGSRKEIFEEQLRYLRDGGFATVVPEDIPHLAGGPEKYVMITFDDGYETDYTIALPALKTFGFRAVSFIVTGFVGRRGYLTWRQVKELKEEGFSIQSHTHTHPLLNSVEKDRIRGELSLSKRIIEDKIGSPVSSVALPGGAGSRIVPGIAREQGYRYVFTSRPGKNEFDRAPAFVFSRILIAGKTTLEKFHKIMNFAPGLYLRLITDYHLRNLVKMAIGPQKYHSLWYRYYKY